MEKTLNNGEKMPTIGFGTWQLTDRETLLNAMESAYKIGYRHFDTAANYENEEIVGEFIKSKDRSQLFITTKLWNDSHDNVRGACKDSMRKLNVEYLDLYLVHFPVNLNGKFDLEKLWGEMESLVRDKLVKSIGVANFGVKNLKKLLSFCKIKPVVDQVELHPYMPQNEVREFCKANGIQVISYSTLGSSGHDKKVVREDPVICEIAKSHGVHPSKVLLAYAVQRGCIVIPRSSSEPHIKSNLELIELTTEELDRIDSIKHRCRYVEVEEFGPERFD